MIEMRGKHDILVGKFRIAAAQDADDVRARDRLVVGFPGQGYLGS